MAYTPVPVTADALGDKLFQNIHRLVSEYAVANSYITVQDSEVSVEQYPVYVIFIPETVRNTSDMRSDNQRITVSVQIDFDAIRTQGYRQTTLMYDAFEAGLRSENANLSTARLRYVSSSTLSNEPIDVNGQQVFSRAEEFTFEVLL